MDFGHVENLLFLKMVWSSRVGHKDKLQPDGNQVGFWNGISFWDGSRPGEVFVSDSHSYAYSLTRGVDNLILVDAHHDLWDSPGDNGVYCHNWARKWLLGGKKRQITWVQPDWSWDLFGIPDDLPKQASSRVVRVRMSECRMPFKPDIVHICRSGCWTPPWTDKAFIEFVSKSGMRAIPLQDGDWNPLIPRWTEKELAAAIKIEEEIQRQIKKLTAGHISA